MMPARAIEHSGVARPRKDEVSPAWIMTGGVVASSRRRGVESSASRAKLIEAAAQLMTEQGYPSVTARRVARRGGLKPQLIHYYFSTMDELFIAVFRRYSEEMLVRLTQAMASGQPMNSLWRLSRDTELATLSLEFLALANRRKAVRNEVKSWVEQIRHMQTEALRNDLKLRGIKPQVEPIVAMMLLNGISQLLMLEKALGISLGHAEAQRFIENCIRHAECAVGSKGSSRKGRSGALRALKRPRLEDS